MKTLSYQRFRLQSSFKDIYVYPLLRDVLENSQTRLYEMIQFASLENELFRLKKWIVERRLVLVSEFRQTVQIYLKQSKSLLKITS